MAWSSLQKSTILLLLALLMSIFAVSPAMAAAQRMLVLATVGSVSIDPGGFSYLPARCLDRYRESPGGWDHFVFAPPSLGSAKVRVGNAPPVPLQSVLNDGRLSITGAGTHAVEVRNNTEEALELTIEAASVLAPDSAPDTDDLAGLSFIGSTEPDIDQFALWEASNVHQLTYQGWTEQQMQLFDVSLSVALGLSEQGLLKEQILALTHPYEVQGLLEAGWTVEQATLDGDTVNRLGLVQLGWSFDQVLSIPDDSLVGAVRLAYLNLSYEEIAALAPAEYGQTEGRLLLTRSGWTDDEIGSLQGDLLVAANLATRGISREVLQHLGANTAGLEAIARWSELQLAAEPGLAQPALPILRLTTGRVPTYLALFPFYTVEVAGNHRLDELVDEVQAYAVDGVAPSVLLLGEGSAGDFDAARLTMIAAASGDGGSKVPITFAGAAAGFPPSGGGPFGINQPSASFPPIQSKKSRYWQKLDFLGRGTVTIAVEASLIDYWYAWLGAMHLGVDVAKRNSGATTLPAAEVIAMIERNIDLQVQAEKARQGLAVLPERAVESSSSIEQQLSRRRYVEIEFEIAPGQSVLVAFHEH